MWRPAQVSSARRCRAPGSPHRRPARPPTRRPMPASGLRQGSTVSYCASPLPPDQSRFPSSSTLRQIPAVIRRSPSRDETSPCELGRWLGQGRPSAASVTAIDEPIVQTGTCEIRSRPLGRMPPEAPPARPVTQVMRHSPFTGATIAVQADPAHFPAIATRGCGSKEFSGSLGGAEAATSHLSMMPKTRHGFLDDIMLYLVESDHVHAFRSDSV